MVKFVGLPTPSKVRPFTPWLTKGWHPNHGKTENPGEPILQATRWACSVATYRAPLFLLGREKMTRGLSTGLIENSTPRNFRGVFWGPCLIYLDHPSQLVSVVSFCPMVNFSPLNIDLGGGFKYFLFSSLFGKDFHFDSYFSNGVVQPPTSDVLGCQSFLPNGMLRGNPEHSAVGTGCLLGCLLDTEVIGSVGDFNPIYFIL